MRGRQGPMWLFTLSPKRYFMLRMGESQWCIASAMSFTAFFPLSWKARHHRLYSFLLYISFSWGPEWLSCQSKEKKKAKKASLGRSMNSTAYLGIEDDETFQKWPLCGLLVCSLPNTPLLGIFGQNPCLWQEEERWKQWSEHLWESNLFFCFGGTSDMWKFLSKG